MKPKLAIKRISRWACCLIAALGSGAYGEFICDNSSSSSAAGSLQDSGGSGNYGNSEYCQFLIQPSGGGDITFSFSSFNYESRYDYLRIYDGTSTRSTRLGSFTGTSLPGTVTATSGAMLIEHETDRSVTRSGFSGNWSSCGRSAKSRRRT